jgi:hypothetical protein
MWVAFALAVGACESGSSLPIDTGTPAPPPPDPGAPSPPPPPESPPSPPGGPPVHSGIPFGPNVFTKSESHASLIPPSSLSPTFTALVDAAYPATLLAKLEAARRTNGRVLLSFAGSLQQYRDSAGFNMAIWKHRVDKFRGFDLSSYIADGTLMGNFIMDEPSDRSNWYGHQVSVADIDVMARYSKEIWPDLPAIIRGWPAYLKGYQYQYLDAAWAQYHERFGPIDAFIANNVRDAKASGLALVLGLNVVAGGGKGGIPGYYYDKSAMTAAQVRSWGGTLLAEPYGCAFFMFTYTPDYFARPDIQAAMAELSQKAQSLPNRPCRRS